MVNPDIVDGAVEEEVRFGRSFSSDGQRLFGVGEQHKRRWERVSFAISSVLEGA